MDKNRNMENPIESLDNVNHIDETMYIVDKIRKLIIEDENISNRTKATFLEYYIQYKFHHKKLEDNIQNLIRIFND